MSLNFKKIELNHCEIFPKDKVNIPSLIEDLELIKTKRPLLYKELKELKDENNNLFNLDDNSKENVSNIQRRYFVVKAYEGLEKRFITNKISEEAKPYYLERFAFELKIINDMKFDGYTLLVSDFLYTLSIKIGGLIGPGRGSAAGSLVSWAFWITNVDPMLEYLNTSSHLLFERYLNPERISLPDIDMDMNGLINKEELLNKIDIDENDTTIKTFINIIKSKYVDDEYLDGKGLIEDYQVALYGTDKVAKIVTRDTYQAKSAIAAVCRYLGNDFALESGFKLKGTPYIEFASRISGNAFSKPGIGFKDIFDENSKFYNPYFVNMYLSNYHVKKVVDLARQLEGTIANYGVHAAGVLILDPKNNYLNNGYMVIGGTNVSVLDGKHVEDYINIKFDFLGLASLEEIDKTLKFIEEKHGKDLRDKVYYEINNEKFLYNDLTTFEKVFDTQNTKKVFQFSSDGMQDLVKRVEPNCFEDLVAITALYRPGPMESGMVDMYVKNKFNPELMFEPFEELKDVLKHTHGTCLDGETLVTTKNGKNLTIKEIVDNNMIGLEVLSLNENNKKLEYKKITKTFNNGIKKIYRVKTTNGYYVDATDNHKVFTSNGWKEVKDLNKNDLLILPKEIKNKSKIEYDKNKLLILAYLLADGDIGGTTPTFINNDIELINNYKNAINNVFDNIKFVEYLRKNNVYNILCTTKNRETYNSNQLINWLNELELKGKRSHTKFIPNFVFDLCEEDILYFLAKYWECDGHISKNGCHVKTISKDICFSIQKLLLKVKINSFITINPYINKIKENQVAYSINISTLDFEKIKKYINSRKNNFTNKFKNLNIISTLKKEDFVNYLLNFLKNKKITKLKFKKETGISLSFFSKSNLNRTIRISTLEKINKFLKDDYINKVIKEEIYCVSIDSIIELDNKIVYDIEVKDNHNFFANNILVHNCVYQEQVMKIVQVLGGFSLGGADLVRRAMGKKIKEELDKLKDQFIEGTVKTYEGRHLSLKHLEQFAIFQEIILYYNGQDIEFKTLKEMNDLGLEEKFSDKEYGRLILKKGTKLNISEDYITRLLANNLFEQIVKFAGYGFNKSHAYAYTNVSMQMAYLKAHYPLEFFASILFNNSNDVEKLSEYIIDATKNGIKIIGPNINLSNYQFDILEDKIIYGLSNIKGISTKDIKKIIDDRNKFGEYKDISDFLNRFIVNLNGSFKTFENLIYSGVLDTLDINLFNTLEKFLLNYNNSTLTITEDKEIYINRLSNKKEYILEILKLDSKFNEENNLLNNILNIFNTDNEKIIPLIVNKILKSKTSTIKKLFFQEKDITLLSEKDNKKYIKDLEQNIVNKEKFINELKEHFDLVENIKKCLSDFKLDNTIENKRVFLLYLFDLLEMQSFNEKELENLNKNIIKNSSIINLINLEFTNIGSVSNIGSILNREYIFKDFKDIPKLNMLLDPFKIEGSFQYRTSVNDIISGVNEDGEPYMSISILDINCLENRIYFSKDQIFRYKNVLNVGDPIIVDFDITLNKEKYYRKLINILVLKEKNNVWETLDVFKLPLISIKDLDKDKIRKNISLKTEFCSLDEIRVDWMKSEKNWPGIEDGNKQVVLILVAYKNITTKDGREFQILELSDGIGYETIEILYSKLNIEQLEKNLRNPVVIELGKRVDNGYGIGAAYKSSVIFLDNSYVLASKEERYEYSEDVNELLDGKEHINVYTRGRTNLGRLLSNFSDIPTQIIHNNKQYTFKTLEGYWFFLKLFILKNEEHFEFLDLNGYEAKDLGSELSKNLDIMTPEQDLEFKSKIEVALRSKIFNSNVLIDLMKDNTLPYLHYYNYKGRIRVLPEFDWLLDIINNIGKEINKTK